MRQVILLRHPITSWNEQHLYLGREDVAWSMKGRRQAIDCWARFKSAQPFTVVSSPSRRCLDLARLISAPARPVIEEGFQEIDFGIFEGHTWQEIAKHYPRQYQKYCQNPSFTFPKGEATEMFQRRVHTTFKKICQEYGGDLLILTHGGVIQTLLSILLAKDASAFWNFLPRHGAASCLKESAGFFQLVSFNEAHYLRSGDSSAPKEPFL